MKKFKLFMLTSLMLVCGFASHAGADILVREDFEDTNFGTRGWYDGTGGVLSSVEHIPGSTKSFECRYLQGGTGCSGGTPMRHLFSETDSVYLSYHVKYSANWQGSNRTYHPHEFLILTNLDGAYFGPSRSHLTAYVEQNEGTPLVQIQDALNIDVLRIGQDLVSVTEQRAVSGCNGDSDGYGRGDCWACGANQCNVKIWLAPRVYFQDEAGPFYKSDWHHIEAYFRLNSISGGKGVADGVIRYWYDGQVVLDLSHVMMRTGQYPAMKFNQLMIAPYIGDGSPVDQSMWVDNLTVATSNTPRLPYPPTDINAR